jgi:hypothetical protein
MEVLLTTFFLETILLHSLSSFQRARRKYFLLKWAKGEMNMKELLWLKNQVWFQRAFNSVELEPLKKNN